MSYAHGRKKTKKKLLLFDVDFDKAFESVNWEFLDSTMDQMGYDPKWRMWIKACLESARASILVNGLPTTEFNFGKGIRQGDPLSPLLFIMVMEGLNVAMKSTGSNSTRSYDDFPSFYADDALFIVNFYKSWVFEIGACPTEVQRAKYLSFGGRLTLVKAVLGNLPTFFMSLFAAPIGGGAEDRKKITRLRYGRFGYGSIRALNLSLLIKWWWRLRTNPTASWARVIKGVHNLCIRPSNVISKKSITGVWNNIACIQHDLKNMGISMDHVITKQIRKGGDTMVVLTRKEKEMPDRRQNLTWWSLMGLDLASNDGWKCGITVDGEFQVAALRRVIDKPQKQVMMDRVEWIREVPIKVTSFIWRALQKRIPSLRALMRRGLYLDLVMCSYFLTDEEDSDHILLLCSFAKTM
uniref:Reverse transcriptase domain-containing protein n=1 Tax=Lactuca sativa TaxID=4236 RepID=A0A9R1W869_LACSA|nr:hypothetical protein LSAT_V11C300139550 [Lactuca sativa]